MLIIDISNLVFGTISDFHRATGEQCDMRLFRHLVINKLKKVKETLSKYSSNEIVIACDSRTGYWRKEVFPYYKADRSKDGSTLDWKRVYECFDQFKQELREYFPVKVIEVDKAEADDIMSVLARRYGANTPVCIWSSDKDLLQIQHMTKGVKQWSSSKNKFITPTTEKYDLFEHIVRAGDDGIPNILSDPDTFVTPNKRQKQLRQVKVNEWKNYGIYEPEKFCDSKMLERFQTNRALIDLNCIPDDIQTKIVEAYEAAVPARGGMFTYLTANRLSQILKEGGF